MTETKLCPCPPEGSANWALAAEHKNHAELMACRQGAVSLLQYWAVLACRPNTQEEYGAFDLLMDTVLWAKTPEEVAFWAAQVLFLARQCEDNPPKATAKMKENGSVRLTWSGTFTQGRFIDIHAWSLDQGTPFWARSRWARHGHGRKNIACPGTLCTDLTWDTGTSRPSAFLADLTDLLRSASHDSTNSTQEG